MFADVDAFNAELQAAGRLGVRRRPAPAGHRHRRPGPGRRDLHDRRPVRRDQGAARRVLGDPGATTWTRRWPGPRRRRGLPRARSRCGRSRTTEAEPADAPTDVDLRSAGSSGRSTAGAWPRWSASSATSTSPRRRCRRRSWCAVERWPGTGCRPTRAPGSSPPPATGRSTGCAGSRTRDERQPRPGPAAAASPTRPAEEAGRCATTSSA